MFKTPDDILGVAVNRMDDGCRGYLCRCQVGRRGAYLIIMSFIFLGHSLSYFVSPLLPITQSNLRLPLDIAPIKFWASVWLVVALIAFVSAFRKSPDKDKWGFLSLSILSFFWAVSYSWAAVAGWSEGAFARGLIAALLYGSLAGVIVIVSGWNEPE